MGRKRLIPGLVIGAIGLLPLIAAAVCWELEPIVCWPDNKPDEECANCAPYVPGQASACWFDRVFHLYHNCGWTDYGSAWCENDPNRTEDCYSDVPCVSDLTQRCNLGALVDHYKCKPDFENAEDHPVTAKRLVGCFDCDERPES